MGNARASVLVKPIVCTQIPFAHLPFPTPMTTSCRYLILPLFYPFFFSLSQRSRLFTLTHFFQLSLSLFLSLSLSLSLSHIHFEPCIRWTWSKCQIKIHYPFFPALSKCLLSIWNKYVWFSWLNYFTAFIYFLLFLITPEVVAPGRVLSIGQIEQTVRKQMTDVKWWLLYSNT